MKKNKFEAKKKNNNKIVRGHLISSYDDKHFIGYLHEGNHSFDGDEIDIKTLKVIDEEKNKEFMLQQLLGYRLGKEGYPIKELVGSANLTKKEWFEIKNEIDVDALSNSDKDEIEEYVNNLT